MTKAGPVRVRFRPTQRGLLNLALLATTVTALGLWFALDHVGAAKKTDNSQVAAGVLLVLPALLAAIVFRANEHPLVSRLLAGVRTLVICAGLSSVAAAGALAGIEPMSHVADTWRFCAVVASLAALAVLGSWLAAHPRLGPLLTRLAAPGPGAMRTRTGVLSAGVIALALLAAPQTALPSPDLFPVLCAAVLAGCSLLNSLTLLGFPGRRLRFVSLLNVVGLLALVWMGQVPWHVEPVVAACGFAILASVFTAALVRLGSSGPSAADATVSENP